MDVGEIAALVGGTLERGSSEKEIKGVGGLYDAEPSDIAFVTSSRYLGALRTTRAGCVLAPPAMELTDDCPPAAVSVIRVEDPREAFEKLVDLFGSEAPGYEEGVHPSAVVSETASVDPSASVGPLCVISDGAAVGPGTVLVGSVFVGAGVKIGEKSLIYPNVTLRERVEIGDRAVIHSGTVLGSDGFGFETDEDGRHHKIAQRGRVIVQDDVEIGACVAVDRARFARTVIGRGTKIDNLVHVAHNVTIGEDCLLVAQVGIAGSSHIGDSVILAGQVGIDGHLSVGDGVRVAGKAGVTSDVEAGLTVAGYPAWPHMKEKRMRAAARRLPELIKEIEELRKRIERLEHTTEND